jgi:hypothetical protein
MSSEASDIDTDDEHVKAERKEELAKRAGFSAQDVEEGMAVVWEVVKPAWRSQMASTDQYQNNCYNINSHFKVDKIYRDLDKTYHEQRRKSNKKRIRQLTKRVDLGRKSVNDGTPWPMIFPCMLDTAWYKDYLSGMADEGIFTQQRDPEGWEVEDNDQNDPDESLYSP